MKIPPFVAIGNARRNPLPPRPLPFRPVHGYDHGTVRSSAGRGRMLPFCRVERMGGSGSKQMGE